MRGSRGERVIELFVCGLPSSGNHLLEAIVMRCAEATGVLVVAKRWHGKNLGAAPAVRDREDAVVLIPVRHPACREMSAKSRKIFDAFPVNECTLNVMRWCSLHRLAPIMVTYEALKSDHVGVTRWLCSTLGLEYAAPPDGWEGVDQPQRGPIFDANRKWLSPPGGQDVESQFGRCPEPGETW